MLIYPIPTTLTKSCIEHQLLQQIAQGDRAAFRRLYESYKDKVYNTALSYLQEASLAEELTQDVFLTIFKKAGNFEGRSKVSTWIYRITVNLSLNLLKKHQRLQQREISLPAYQEQPDFVHPGVLLERQEQAKFLFAAIYKLGERQQTAFILSYVEGLPRQEVADIMELSLKAIEGLLLRAKANLRKLLISQYPEGKQKK